jgi:hypothetical protein
MSIKQQPDIRDGDRCVRCGERVRPLLDDGAPAERVEGGATSVGWTCACATIEGPQVPADQCFVVATEPLLNDEDKQAIVRSMPGFVEMLGTPATGDVPLQSRTLFRFTDGEVADGMVERLREALAVRGMEVGDVTPHE